LQCLWFRNTVLGALLEYLIEEIEDDLWIKSLIDNLFKFIELNKVSYLLKWYINAFSIFTVYVSIKYKLWYIK